MTSWKMIREMKDPYQIFDMVVFACYVHGDQKIHMPVDEARKCFERIQELIVESGKTKSENKKDSSKAN